MTSIHYSWVNNDSTLLKKNIGNNMKPEKKMNPIDWPWRITSIGPGENKRHNYWDWNKCFLAASCTPISLCLGMCDITVSGLCTLCDVSWRSIFHTQLWLKTTYVTRVGSNLLSGPLWTFTSLPRNHDGTSTLWTCGIQHQLLAPLVISSAIFVDSKSHLHMLVASVLA